MKGGTYDANQEMELVFLCMSLPYFSVGRLRDSRGCPIVRRDAAGDGWHGA